MKKQILALFLSLSIICSACPLYALAAGDDIAAPVVTGVTMDNPGATVVAGDTLYFEVQVTDESEITYMYIQFSHSEGTSQAEALMDSYDQNAGVMRLCLTVKEDMSDGVWKVARIYVRDSYNNCDNIEDCNGLSDIWFTVNGNLTDISAPVVTGVTMDTPGATVVAGDTLYFDVQVTDESEITYMYIQFSHSEGTSQAEAHMDSYDQNAGVMRLHLTVKNDMSDGVWKVARIYVRDSYNNCDNIEDYSGFSDIWFTVGSKGILPTAVSIPENITVAVNDVYTIRPDVEPITSIPEWTWTTSDADIAEIHSSADGMSANVTGMAPGVATITGVTSNGLTVSCDVTVIPVTAAHTHSICGSSCPHTEEQHENITFDNVLTADTIAISDGNYYLNSNVTLAETLQISGTVNLCLNGYMLTGDGTDSVINIEPLSTLNLCDCNGSNSVHSYSVDETGLWVFEERGEYELSGGVITGGSSAYGGGIYNTGVFTFYSGAVSGNKATCSGGGISANSNFTMYGGYITGNTAEIEGGGVTVFNSTFTMNGGSISKNTSPISGGVSLPAVGSMFVMNDGMICDNDAESSVTAGNGAEFIMNGGLIDSIYAECGVVACDLFEMNGGIIRNHTYAGIDQYGTFTMSGGIIEDNLYGIHNSGTVKLIDGTIRNNKSTGVQLRSSAINNEFASVDMLDGVISGNEIGIFLNTDSALTLRGGSITENAECGVFVESNVVFSVSGSPIVSQNTSSEIARNVFLCTGAVIIIDDTTNDIVPLNKASIGVTVGDVGVITITGENTLDYSEYFTSDSAEYEVVRDGHVLKLYPVYTVSYFDDFGTGTLPEAVDVLYGQTVSIAGRGDLTRDGYEFAGWNTKADGTGESYFEWDSFTVTSDIMLYAQWKENTILASGYCGGEGDGTNLAWTLTTDGILTISGTGVMAEYETATAPWYSYRAQITRAVLENRVTTIGDYAFADCENLADVTIPESVIQIGSCTFAGSSVLKNIMNGTYLACVTAVEPYGSVYRNVLTVYGLPFVIVITGARIAEGSYWLVKCDEDNGVATAYASPTIINGTQTVIYWNRACHVIDGVEYADSNNYVLDAAETDLMKQYTWFLDEDGCVIGSVEPVSVEDYAVVMYAKWVDSDTTIEEGYVLANLAYMDGTSETGRIVKINGNPVQGVEGSGGVSFADGYVSTTTQYNTDTMATLYRVVRTDDGLELTAVTTDLNIQIFKGKSQFTTEYYADNDTTFLFYHEEQKYITSIVGIDNLPLEGYDAKNVDVVVDLSSGVAKFVYLPTWTEIRNPAADNIAALEALKSHLEFHNWTVDQKTANTEKTVKLWIEQQIGNMALNGAEFTVNVTAVTPAVAGNLSDQDGTSGGFSFDVTLTKGSHDDGNYAETTATITNGVITATVYVPVEYTVYYNANGGSGKLPASVKAQQDTVITVAEQGNLKNGNYQFVGWNTRKNGTGIAYQPGSQLTIKADTTLYAQWRVTNCAVSGEIKAHKAEYSAITVRLDSLDGVIYVGTVGEGVSNNSENKTLYPYTVNAPKGTYTLYVIAVTTEGVTVTRSARVTLGDNPITKDFNLPDGQTKNKKSEVKVDKDAPQILAGGLDVIVDQEEIDPDVVAVEVALVVKAVEETSEEAEKISEQVVTQSSDEKLEFVELTVEKVVTDNSGEKTTENLSNLTNLIQIVIPFDCNGRNNVQVYRYHDGIVDTLTTTPNEDGEYIELGGDHIVLHSKKFSTYAIGYSNDPGAGEPVVEYTVTFNSNGGSGEMETVVIEEGTGYTLPECGFTAPEGKKFKVWSVNGVEYAAGDTVTVTANIIVSAIWEDIAQAPEEPETPETPEKPDVPVIPDLPVIPSVPSVPTTETETIHNKDGSITTIVTNKKTGTVTATTKYHDGTVLEIVTAANGTQEINVTVPAGITAEVTIPVEDVNMGTVAVIVHEDGTEEIVQYSIPNENGLTVTLSESAHLKIVDNAKAFTDVDDEAWFKNAVDFVSARGIMNGTGDDFFSHGETTTRAMVWTMLARLNGEDTSGGANWYEKGLEWAKENDISDGTNATGEITREQLVVMLWRLSGSPKAADSSLAALSGYTDGENTGGYAKQAMAWAVANGIISGVGDNVLNPNGNATRAQVAQIIMNFMMKI